MKITNDLVARNAGERSWAQILQFFPADLRTVLAGIKETVRPLIIELRLRINQPLEVNLSNENWFVASNSVLTSQPREGLLISQEIMAKTLTALTTGSVYALEEEFSKGYLTLPGGHRLGFTGRVLQEGGRIRLIRNISSLNLRVAKAVLGIARPVLPFLWQEERFLKTLILAPPGAGKTTLLREIIREISWGLPELEIPGLHVGVVDERSELAGSVQGIAQLDLGPRTDVLDACPKKDGVYLLLRAMNPELIATDEIGREDDQEILQDIVNAGVSFIATAHAKNFTEAIMRPGLRRILESGSIERFVTLSNRNGIGTIEGIRAGPSGPELYNK